MVETYDRSASLLIDDISRVTHPQPWPGISMNADLSASALRAVGEILGTQTDAWHTYMTLAVDTTMPARELAEAVARLEHGDRGLLVPEQRDARLPGWVAGAAALAVYAELPAGFMRAVFEHAAQTPDADVFALLHRSPHLPADVDAAMLEIGGPEKIRAARFERRGLTSTAAEQLWSGDASALIWLARERALLRIAAERDAATRGVAALEAAIGRTATVTVANHAGAAEHRYGTLIGDRDNGFALAGPVPAERRLDPPTDLRGVYVPAASDGEAIVWVCRPCDVVRERPDFKPDDFVAMIASMESRLTADEFSHLVAAAKLLSDCQIRDPLR